MKGILYAFIGGALITLQGVFNAKLSSEIGIWSTSIITHFIGFIVALIIFFLSKETLHSIKKLKSFYIIGGTFGAIIVFSETLSIHMIGITLTVAILMISQLIASFLVEINGFFGVKKIKIEKNHIIGLFLMSLGIVLYNFN